MLLRLNVKRIKIANENTCNIKGANGMSENICKFAQSKNIFESINIINFVYEKEADFKQSFIYSACHGMYLVIQGNGILHTAKNDHALSRGSLFFTFSSKPYYIQNTGELRYIYISFIGLRASALFERLGINYVSPVYDGFSFLCERWIDDFDSSRETNIDLVCEGLLLHTLSYLCRSSEESAGSVESGGMLKLKAYVDMYYTQPDLSLQTVSRKFNYSYKYVSNAFSRLTRIPFSNYLCNLRLSHARQLLGDGITGVQEVAYSSGFSSAQYFSKAFKKKYGLTPTEFCRQSSVHR